MSDADTDDEARHAAKMAKKKAARDKLMADKTDEKGLIIVHTGPGKGKSSSGFGMILRCIAHGMPSAVVQFIKGAWQTGERTLIEAHFSDPTCAACHAAMDGIGFTFESIDWLGRHRTEEKGKPIDDSAEFTLDGEQISVRGVAEMAAALGDSADIAECVASQWASYAAGVPDKEETACVIEHLAGVANG